MENLVKYTHVDVSHITLSAPEKTEITNRFSSEVLYNGKPFYIQTPVIKLHDSSFSFELVNNGPFFNMFESLAERIIDLLHENSSSFFNGKTFSKERLNRSLKPFYSVSEGTVTVGSVINMNCVFLNSCNEEITVEQHKRREQEGTAILCIDTLVFENKSCSLLIYTEFLKTLKTQKQQVFLEEPETEELEPKTIETEIEEPETTENDDDLEFFS
jgi:hypothetical protein